MRRYRNKFSNLNMLFMMLLLVLAVYILSNHLKNLPKDVDEDDIEENDITFFGRDSCPFCVKMKNQLQNDGMLDYMEYVDVETPEGAEAFQNSEGDGAVPYFECASTGKSSTGFKPTKTLVKDLGLS